MAGRKHDFAEADKLRALLWCGRHCCLCGKEAGVGIEVAHLDPKRADLDNAIPLCFDCHTAIGHYNREHPRGRKYSIPELKARRDQIYEQHTRHLVPPVMYSLKQSNRKLPDAGFHISNLGATYPIRARIRVTLSQAERTFTFPSGHYGGTYLWNLNPSFSVSGHFEVSEVLVSSDPTSLRARIDVTLIDIYDREHTLLPVGYVHTLGATDDWYFEPSEGQLPKPVLGVSKSTGAA